MSVFTEDEVNELSKGGNDAFNKVYLAKLNTREYILPNGSDENKLKDFIKQKYVEKRWHQNNPGGVTSHTVSGGQSFQSEESTNDFPSDSGASSTVDPNRISINLKGRQTVSNNIRFI
jgi:hypothetical protein